MHTDFACLLFSHLKHRPHPETVKRIIMEAVTIEQELTGELQSFVFHYIANILIRGAPRCSHRNEFMQQYIEFVADRLLVSLDNEKVYKSTNPFDFMDMISLQGKSNFLEKRVSDYSKANTQYLH
jgi:ribonucleoside-diphosphate reductase subunit M2